MSYRVNTPPVIHQTLDGEVIAVDLESGTYYSIAGTGAEVWGAVEQGLDVDEVIELIAGRYDTDRAWIEQSVTRFVGELAEQQLIVPAEHGDRPAPAAPEQPTGTTFEEPVLNRYTDMQELLMLDPIHEVDEQGWPNSREPVEAVDEG